MFKALLSLLLFFAFTPLIALAAESLPRFEPAPCPATLPNRQVECGFLLVPEDRAQSNTPTIKIAVAVLKAIDANPAPDPILIVNGGPGSEALSDLPRFVNTFAYLTADPKRDVIIFDQRGLGLSQPALGCPELGPLLLQQAKGVEIGDDALQAAYAACRDHWVARGVNLAAYSTAASAADINDLWHTLGYKQVNLYGVSYGTILAQTAARDYPNGIRSVVLDSAYPLSIRLLADSAGNLHKALEQVFTDCTADWACRLSYPDLPAAYAQTVEQLQAKPALLTFSDSANGQTLHHLFTAADFVDLLRQAPAAITPAFIYAIHEGDYSNVSPQLQAGLENAERYGPPPNRASTYSVMCSQAMYQVTPEQVAEATYPESSWARRFIQRDLFPLPCDQWPHALPDPKDSQPWTSDIPTLILHGINDSTLSPSYNNLFTATYRQGTLLTVPDTGHGILPLSLCANTIARAFINDPGQQLNSSCLTPPAFRLGFKYTLRGAIVALPIQMASGLLGLGIVWAVVAAVPFIRRRQFSLSAKHSLQRLGWALPLAAVGLCVIGLAGGLQFIGLDPFHTLATILVPLAALQAAFVFSPEDEPMLEVTLATPRPLAWTVVERWGVLVATYAVLGLGLSFGAAAIMGEPVWVTVGRWLPALIFLSALSVILSLILRRALISLSLISLLWFAAYFLGGTMIQVWPFAWPINLYIEPEHLYFWLNRLWLALAGVGLMIYASLRLVQDEERLLLGPRRFTRSKAAPLVSSESETTEYAEINSTPSALRQLLGIVQYEVLMQFRQPGLAVFALCLLIIPLINAVIGNEQLNGLSASVAAGLTPADYAQTLVTNQILPIAWLGGLLVSLLVIFIIVADTLPKDKLLDVFEILQSLPLSSNTYLLGKVLSVWAALGLAVLGSALLTSAVNWVRFGAFNLGLYWEMWIVGIGSLVFINSALGVLLTAAQANNRRAVLAGVLLAVGTLALMTAGFLFIQSGWSHFLPGRPSLSLYYLMGYPGASLGPTNNSALTQVMGSLTSQSAALLDIAAGFGEVLVLGLIVGWWLKRSRLA
jgi:pimeloyl-ACP methyl ester carboxylesterase